MAVIIDLDGTLSDPGHRRPLLEKDNDWEEFFRRVDEDPVNDWCRKIVDKFRGEEKILLVTGRPEVSKEGVPVRDKTLEWLEEKDIVSRERILSGDGFRLVMREEGDFRDDVTVKLEMLEEKLPEPEGILFAVDDREDVADMWRGNGITCLQVEDNVTK
jgi:hypothetical protein